MLARSDAGPGRFGAGPEYTVGVEEELMLLDPESLALVPLGPEVVVDVRDPVNVKTEIRRSMLEISSAPHAHAAALLDDLAALRRKVARAAARRGLRVAGAGTHAFSSARSQPVTEQARYARIFAETAWLSARGSAVFGTHVHVALRSGDKAVAVAEALVADLPALVALGAASPLSDGVDTGLASARLAAWSALPRTGLPPTFADHAAFVRHLRALVRCGAISDASELWWDVRWPERLGTIEVRVLDAQPSVVDAAALAALVQAVVRHHGRRYDAGARPHPDRMIATENRWLAIRDGLDAQFVSEFADAMPARAAVCALLDRVREDVDACGASWAIPHVAALAATGGAASDIRRRLHRTGDPVSVMAELVEQGEQSVESTLEHRAPRHPEPTSTGGR